MSFANVPLSLLKTPPQNVLGSLISGFGAGAKIIPGIREAQAKAGLTKAQTALAKAKVPALPYQAVGAYLSGLGRMGQTSLSGNPAYIMARMVNSPALLAMASQDPKFAKNLGVTMQKLGQQASQQGLPGQAAAQQAPAMLQSIAQDGGTPATQSTYDQLMPPPHHAQNQINSDNSAIVEHTKNASDWTSEDVKKFQQSLSDAFLKKTTTANIMNQRQYAGILDNLFNRADPLIPSVAKYAGFKGKTQKGLNAFASASGASSPDYQNYLMFTRTIAPVVANEMRRTLGGQASDKEKETMDAIVNPAYWDSNPATAMKQWNFLVNTYRHSVNPALMASPSKVVNRFGSTQPFVTRKQEKTPTAVAPTKRHISTLSDAELQRIIAGGK